MAAATETRAQCRRREQDDIERELAAVAPSEYMAIADDDPRRCPEAGAGALHDIRQDTDGVWRCWNCRRRAISPEHVGGYR
jgi:hypothetical protein